MAHFGRIYLGSRFIRTSARCLAAGASVALAAGRMCATDEIITRSSNQASTINNPIIKEHRTGQQFDLVRSSIPGSTHELFLLGTNVRCMLGWCKLAMARGYAFGLYLDEGAFVKAKSLHDASQVDSLLDAKQIDPSIGEISLVLVMARNIPGGHLSHGFNNAILNRLKQLTKRQGGLDTAIPAPNRAAALASGKATATGQTTPEAAAALASAPVVPSGGSYELAELNALAAAFNALPDFQAGEEIAFVWRQDGTLAASARGQLLPVGLTQPRLVRALFDVYAGPSPVSARGKATFTRNLRDVTSSCIIGDSGVRLDRHQLAEVIVREHTSRTK